jgi:hypothetical protein
VREELAKQSPLSAIQLAERLCVEVVAVKRSINQMITTQGGIAVDRSEWPFRYRLYTPPPIEEGDDLPARPRKSKGAGSGVIAGRRLIRGYVF